MKRAILCAAALAFLVSSNCWAYTLDGDLSDWGMANPFTDWTPSGTAFAVNGNNIKGPNVPGTGAPIEAYDIELAALDNDGQYLYFALVSSTIGNWGIGSDLALDIGDDGNFETGVKFDNFYTLNKLVSLPVIGNTQWTTNHYGEWGLPLNVTGGTQVGTASAYQRMYTNLEGTGKGLTYIIEGSISLDMLGIASLCDIPIELIWTRVSCLKDSIRLNGVCTGDCGGTEIPEPSTVLLLGSALAGFGGFRKRSKKV